MQQGPSGALVKCSTTLCFWESQWTEEIKLSGKTNSQQQLTCETINVQAELNRRTSLGLCLNWTESIQGLIYCTTACCYGNNPQPINADRQDAEMQKQSRLSACLEGWNKNDLSFTWGETWSFTAPGPERLADLLWPYSQEWMASQRICYFRSVATFLATVISDSGQDVA